MLQRSTLHTSKETRKSLGLSFTLSRPHHKSKRYRQRAEQAAHKAPEDRIAAPFFRNPMAEYGIIRGHPLIVLILGVMFKQGFVGVLAYPFQQNQKRKKQDASNI